MYRRMRTQLFRSLMLRCETVAPIGMPSLIPPSVRSEIPQGPLWCSDCSRYETPAHFRWRMRDTLMTRVECRTTKMRRSNRKRKGNLRSKNLKEKYGITESDYDSMLSDQGGVCAICADPPKDRALCVDHDHSTGAVRALLCNRCNLGLGYFRDDAAFLQKATEYLTTHSS